MTSSEDFITGLKFFLDVAGELTPKAAATIIGKIDEIAIPKGTSINSGHNI